MKTKLLFWSAILFFALGRNTGDSLLCYFFSIHLLMLSVGMFIHKHANKPQAGLTAEPLPKTAEADKQ
jgi:hypothetical protein